METAYPDNNNNNNNENIACDVVKSNKPDEIDKLD